MTNLAFGNWLKAVNHVRSKKSDQSGKRMRSTSESGSQAKEKNESRELVSHNQSSWIPEPESAIKQITEDSLGEGGEKERPDSNRYLPIEETDFSKIQGKGKSPLRDDESYCFREDLQLQEQSIYTNIPDVPHETAPMYTGKDPSPPASLVSTARSPSKWRRMKKGEGTDNGGGKERENIQSNIKRKRSSEASEDEIPIITQKQRMSQDQDWQTDSNISRATPADNHELYCVECPGLREPQGIP